MIVTNAGVESDNAMEIETEATSRLSERLRSLWICVLVALVTPAGVGCGGDKWSDSDRQKFFAICGGGKGDPTCECLAGELPKSMAFEEYARFSDVSKAMALEAVDDDILKKMAQAAAVCAKR